MTDRELLEFAAKAAGLRLTWDGDNPPYPRASEDGHWNPHWNPLIKDGDALRLAVKLGMCVTAFTKTEDAMVGYRIGDDGRNIEESWGTDPYAATRRAIVRAAAEIGKAMQ